jgi:hypothetical protein
MSNNSKPGWALMSRPPSMVQVAPEDQKALEDVGDMWIARMSMCVWRETDGTFWADPAEYAEWRAPGSTTAKEVIK